VSGRGAGLDGVTFLSSGCRLVGGFYRAAGETPRPTAVLIHGTPGIEKHLDIAYRLRDLGWNCLYFHFRGSWGSQGCFSFTHLVDDVAAAVAWVRGQPSVDTDRIALVGGAMGGHAALLCSASDPGIRAVVAVCPLIEPRAWSLPEAMADEFAPMLAGVTSGDLLAQWAHVRSLADRVDALRGRPTLLITADQDGLWPPAHYADFAASVADLEWVRSADADHAFSECRPWLVSTVADWLVARLGR
jgi:uncharacterized protein